MRSVRAICSPAILLALAAYLAAQDISRPPLPIWPENGVIPKGMEQRYVFLTREGDALVVLLPKDPKGDLEGEKRPVRVPLNNQLAPFVSVTDLQEFSRGMYRYSYEMCNEAQAKDAIEVISFPLPAGRKRFCMKHEASAFSWRGPCSDNLPRGAKIEWPGSLGRMSWTRPSDAPAIGPGQCLAGFTIESDYRPGLAWVVFSMYTVRFAPDRMTWPEEVLAQLNLKNEAFQKHFATIAPVFPPEAPKSEIAAHFRRGIEELEKVGRVDHQSPFVVELKEALERVAKASDAQLRLSLRPTASSPTEEEIFRAVQISLGIQDPSTH